jgi:hypothetical protein
VSSGVVAALSLLKAGCGHDGMRVGVKARAELDRVAAVRVLMPARISSTMWCRRRG